MKAVRDTSIISYQQIRMGRLGKLQQKVYEIIRLFPGSTDREIIRRMGIEGNSVRPRRYELLKKGVIEIEGKRICSVTGKLAYTWKLIDMDEEPLFIEVNATTLKQQKFIPRKDFIWLAKVMRAQGYEYEGHNIWKKRRGE